MAGETAPLIQLRLEPMPTIYECIDRVVAARPLIVAPLAAIGLVTDGAISPLHSRHSPMEIVSPADRMRLRAHHGVAFIAGAVRKGTLLSPCYGLERRTQTGNKLVTESALGFRSPRGIGVPDPERSGVVERPLGQGVIAGLAAGGDLGVADRAVADAILVAGPPRLVAHRAVPHRWNVQLGYRSLLADVCVTGLARDPGIANVGKVLRMRELQISAVHRVSRRCRRIHFTGYLGGVGIDYEAAKLVIVRILLLDGGMTAEAVFVLGIGSQPRLDVGN